MKLDSIQLEKYSSAITLSDMEIFVFPELMYSLVLANIMSPVIWKWRKLDCFKKLEGKSRYKKLLRLKQFIIDEYEFNLDLETWGLTSQKKEIERFAKFISPEKIAKSNALFGYQGDKYYFDVDIRRHFGLDKYNSDIIPYWKTETVEAMDAFKLKGGYKTGAGECVSLAALYAAAAFIVCQIPLEDIYMILTPLHSQNFIDMDDGVLTNNRRIVTKTMWFNGTEISNKAQRAIRNEQITIVAHNSGYVHCLYEDATIAKAAYEHFNSQLKKFLSTKLDVLTMANFLRCHGEYQKYFQFCCEQCKHGTKYVKAEVLFHYEHGSRFRIAEDTFEKLLDEVSEEDLMLKKLPDRLCCNQFYNFIIYEELDVMKSSDREKIKKYAAAFVEPAAQFMEDLVDFIYTEPNLPAFDKNFVSTEPLKLSVEMQREDVINYLEKIRDKSETAALAFYAYRDIANCDWSPFVKAAIERNPVSIQQAESMTADEIYDWLGKMKNDSIYSGKRLAQPDEVVSFQTGDGLEKAFVLANIIRNRNPKQNLKISVYNNEVTLEGRKCYVFSSSKGLTKEISI